MNNNKVEVPMRAVTDNMYDELSKAKALLARMKNGQEFIDKSMRGANIIEASKGVRLYNKYAEEAFHHLERALFIHEFLTTGAGVVISRDGKAVKVEDIVDDKDGIRMVDPWTLRSVEKLKEVFGEDFITFVDLK